MNSFAGYENMSMVAEVPLWENSGDITRASMRGGVKRDGLK